MLLLVQTRLLHLRLFFKVYYRLLVNHNLLKTKLLILEAVLSVCSECTFSKYLFEINNKGKAVRTRPSNNGISVQQSSHATENLAS